MLNTKTPALPEIPWYRVPFVWFAISLLLLTVVAGTHLIVISLDVDDESVLDEGHGTAFRVPVAPDAAVVKDKDTP